MKKYSFMIALCAALLMGGMQPLPVSQAASRQEMAAIRVVQAKDFRYWTADSPVKAALVQYVEKVIDRKSPDFIPAADRVAVFDMDGTLMCETAPSYFDSLLYQKRVLDDGSWQPSADMRAAAVESRSALQQKRHSRMGEEEEEAYQMNAFELENIQKGSCLQRCIYEVAVMRALGIPANSAREANEQGRWRWARKRPENEAAR